MKILNEAHVPDKNLVNHLEKITNKIFEVNRVTFSDDELPVEGTEHNKALYLTVKCEDFMVTRVLVDNGSSAKISPLSTLNKLKVDDERIHKNRICVRGFSGGGKDSMVKFEWDRQEIVVHGEENLCAHSDASIPFIKAEDDKGLWVYQVFEIVLVEKGIIQPVSLPENLGAFGLEFEPTVKDMKRVKRSFVKPGARKCPVTTVPSSVVDIDKELIESIQRLFDDVIMVEVREECDDESEYDEDEAFEELIKELSHFEEKSKPNLNKTEAINLEDLDNVIETKISVHLEPQIREEIVKAFFEYKDIFAWSYDDMPSLSTDLVVHKFPIDPTFPPVKQKLRKFKTDMSVNIKEEVIKQLDVKVIRVTRYPMWLANVVHVPTKDGKTRVCVDYRDLNKASPKDNFPPPNIHILIDNFAKHEIGSFVDCYAGYHKILMDEEDAEKIEFITLWGTYCYRVMPFSLKNIGATYMRAMTTIFHDIIHKEIEVYMDDMIIKSRKQSDHINDLRKFCQRLCRYNLKLNPAKCVFGVPLGKLLGFIVSRQGIKLDPSKIKAIQELPPPKNKTEHDIIGRKEHDIYYLNKKFTFYEVKYAPLKRTCCALTWVAQKLKHYLSSYTTYLISHLDHLKYIFQKPMPTGRLAKWQILLIEFDIVYVTRTAIKAQALADHLAENPVDEEYEPLRTYLPDEEVMHIDKVEKDEKTEWKLFFDGDANIKGVGIGAVLVSETGHHYPVTAQLYFYCTNNMAEYEACIMGLRLVVDMGIQEVLVLGDSNLLVWEI
ncbi:uncharacterized protein [Nicotiana sylvestris]|uniref:uncharacterized protein n=1 Tax=Nicotiana sylvestris TaxID=4096 RepID=UPI00388C8463